jgi:hypothetical protein
LNIDVVRQCKWALKISNGMAAFRRLHFKRSLTPRLTGKNAEHFCPR